MFRLEQSEPSEFIVWENNKYLGSMSQNNNGSYEYIDKLGRRIVVDNPVNITQILERKLRELRE